MPDRHVWRIGTDTPLYEADDLSGAGAKATGGRWNEPGLPMVYSASSIALACLETVVHLNTGGLPFNRYLVQITIPDDVWGASQIETPGTLKVGWDAQPAGRGSIAFGSDWLRGGATSLLYVPSAIIPEEVNILINPAHPQISRIRAIKLRRWLYDPRLEKH